MKPFEVIKVNTVEVKCDGEVGPMGHPRVFLHLDKTSHQIQCPYCSRLYVLDESAQRKVG